jgi:hypothetical protein
VPLWVHRQARISSDPDYLLIQSSTKSGDAFMHQLSTIISPKVKTQYNQDNKSHTRQLNSNQVNTYIIHTAIRIKAVFSSSTAQPIPHNRHTSPSTLITTVSQLTPGPLSVHIANLFRSYHDESRNNRPLPRSKPRSDLRYDQRRDHQLP